MGKTWSSRESSLVDVVAEAEGLLDTIEMLPDDEFDELQSSSNLYDELLEFVRAFKYNV